MPTHSDRPTARQPEGVPSEPPEVAKMFSDISKHFQATASEFSTLRKKFYELEMALTTERGVSQRAAREQGEKLVQAKEERDSYVRAIITSQALDITAGICNVSGKLLSENDKIYILEGCGAVSTRHNANKVSTC